MRNSRIPVRFEPRGAHRKLLILNYQRENLEINRHGTTKRRSASGPFPEYPAKGAYSGGDLPREWNQAAGPDRIVRSVCSAAQEQRQPDDLQARHLDHRSVARGAYPGGRPGAGQQRRLRPAGASSARSGDGVERAILVRQGQSATEADLEELKGLAEAAGALVVATVVSHRRFPVAGTFIGSGKVAELADLVAREEADVVVFDQELTPVQERNLERAVKCRVIDRTRLILDIFALRARTAEGKLQVELAQLRHLSTRLVRGWTHLERQKGGIGLR